MNINDRIRKVDIESKTPEEIDALGVQLGDKTKEIIDDAVNSANKLLGIYGLEVMAAFKIAPKGTKEKLEMERKLEDESSQKE